MAKKDAARALGRTLMIEVPVAEEMDLEKVYCPRHVEVQLDSEQAKVMRRMYDGLHGDGHKLRNGRYVQRPADVIRWMLENVAE